MLGMAVFGAPLATLGAGCYSAVDLCGAACEEPDATVDAGSDAGVDGGAQVEDGGTGPADGGSVDPEDGGAATGPWLVWIGTDGDSAPGLRVVHRGTSDDWGVCVGVRAVNSELLLLSAEGATLGGETTRGADELACLGNDSGSPALDWVRSLGALSDASAGLVFDCLADRSRCFTLLRDPGTSATSPAALAADEVVSAIAVNEFFPRAAFVENDDTFWGAGVLEEDDEGNVFRVGLEESRSDLVIIDQASVDVLAGRDDGSLFYLGISDDNTPDFRPDIASATNVTRIPSTAGETFVTGTRVGAEGEWRHLSFGLERGGEIEIVDAAPTDDGWIVLLNHDEPVTYYPGLDEEEMIGDADSEALVSLLRLRFSDSGTGYGVQTDVLAMEQGVAGLALGPVGESEWVVVGRDLADPGQGVRLRVRVIDGGMFFEERVDEVEAESIEGADVNGATGQVAWVGHASSLTFDEVTYTAMGSASSFVYVTPEL